MAQKFSVKLKFARISPDKIRLILNMIKNKKTDYAMPLLQNLPNRSAWYITKVLKSALAAAKEKNLSQEQLYISEAYCNEVPHLKMFRPLSRGRSTSVAKKSSHIHLTLTDEQPKEKKQLRKAK